MNEDRRKRVAIVGTQGLPAHYGGFETLVENLVRNNNHKIAYTVFCSRLDLSTHAATFEGARLKYIPLHSNGVQSVLYDLLSLLRAIRGYDTILVLGVSGCVFLPLVKLLNSAKIIVNIDGLEHKRKKWNNFARRFLRLSERVAVRYADTIIADNKGIQNYVADTYHRDSELIAYGGDQVLVDVPEEIQTASLAEYGLAKNSYALTICRMEAENNVDMILDAFKDVTDKIVVVGNFQSNRYAQKLKQTYEHYSNILLLDAIYDRTKLYTLRNNAKQYVHGHSAGGTNPSLVEAMFFGRPILAYDVNYNRVTTSNLAEYFSNAADLKKLIAKEPADGSLLQQVANEQYRWQIISNRYEQLY